uniref:Macaca fascicularis brain cDNA clone: QflA-22341, similar to human serine (or cysteine) proteinase inhibitor, clade B(ovalbumin), member 9 (SERPINB9), mRNA, RefSeq: NM_004155.3 n=1 Tax=Macaca fascicularis TaxID=9541 RepID=I7GNT7_MACFA|nr:unnamed protein product [Macaca fascicularis]
MKRKSRFCFLPVTVQEEVPSGERLLCSGAGGWHACVCVRLFTVCACVCARLFTVCACLCAPVHRVRLCLCAPVHRVRLCLCAPVHRVRLCLCAPVHRVRLFTVYACKEGGFLPFPPSHFLNVQYL